MPVVATIGATVLGGMMGSKASRDAAQTQADAADRATQAQAAALAQQRADLEPWRKSGELANNKLTQMLGLNGPSTFTSDDPSYAFRFNEGQKAVDNGAAARGMSLSGGALKALQKYGQDQASTEFQNSYNRLAGLSNTGQSAAAGQATAQGSYGQAQANNITGAGNAQAAGQVGASNAWNSAIGQGVSNYQQNQLMNLIGGKSSYTPEQSAWATRMNVPTSAPGLGSGFDMFRSND